MIKKRPNGRFQARVFHAGREVASKTFDLKKDALSREDEQQRKLLANEWVDPQAGKAPLGTVLNQYVEQMRGVIGPRTWGNDEANYRDHVPARLRKWPISAVTAGQLDKFYAHENKAGLACGTSESRPRQPLERLRTLTAHAQDESDRGSGWTAAHQSSASSPQAARARDAPYL
ncbi:hypothetical protein [Pseudoclavibacter terrae]|uniref:Site-specific integrase n=1 Tax=Pseudoclavibacter terrae TaxID=1530195 RepID=A0A7J5B6S2_9MICO|nr:hypothetical protein [Pseudoclavibacter terrae]KAB1639898.1 hypothetical protein F8O03_06215 [Pseudoclavibacter terrae]